jgi:hypothetical protein
MRRTFLHRIKRRSRLYTIIFLVLFCVGAFAVYERADQAVNGNKAVFYFVKPASTLYVNQPYTIELHVNTKGNTINAVSSVLTFNPSELEVLNMTTDKSFCSFYTDNSFDTIKGEVRIGCGTPSPGFNGDSIIVALQVRATTPGSIPIHISPQDAFILANDGKGTNLLGAPPVLTLPIKQSF